MNKNTDWAAWDKDFGPRNMDEAKALKAVAEGQARSGSFFGEWSPNKKAWLISRDRQRWLRLNEGAARQGFIQFLWYCTSEQKPWRTAPRTILDILFQD